MTVRGSYYKQNQLLRSKILPQSELKQRKESSEQPERQCHNLLIILQ